MPSAKRLIWSSLNVLIWNHIQIQYKLIMLSPSLWVPVFSNTQLLPKVISCGQRNSVHCVWSLLPWIWMLREAWFPHDMEQGKSSSYRWSRSLEVVLPVSGTRCRTLKMTPFGTTAFDAFCCEIPWPNNWTMSSRITGQISAGMIAILLRFQFTRNHSMQLTVIGTHVIHCLWCNGRKL